MKAYNGPITKLEPNQRVIFGCNPTGYNGNPSKGTGGAALAVLKIANVRQNEVIDNCLSESGLAFGITTVTRPGAKRSKQSSEIIQGIYKAYEQATSTPELEYFVMYQGAPFKMNLNGYTNSEMAKMFAYFGYVPENICFEIEFYNEVRRHQQSKFTFGK